MTEKETEPECCHCGDEASEIIYLDNGKEEMVCDSCEDSEYFTCPEYGTVHKMTDGWEVDGELYSYDAYQEYAVTCEWSGTEIHRDNAVCVNGDYYVQQDYECDVSCCADCGHEGHYEDFEYNDRYEEYYCSDCNPRRGNEWYNNFRKISSNFDAKPKRNEVKNWVGIEFEIENAHNGPFEDEMPEFAMAEPDGSLNDGLEYKTHVQKGEDVKNVINKFCKIIPDYGMTASDRTIGWHFHYSLEEREDGHIRNMGKSFADFSDMVQNVEGFDYFRNMIRGYARTLPSGFKRALRTYDGKQSLYEHTRSMDYGYPPRGCMINLTRLLQRASSKGNEQRRVEIRMYSPRAFLQNFDNFHPNASQRDRHYLLGQDYHTFILFWDEFMRKSAVRRLNTTNNNGDLMNLRQFSRQFSPMVRKWLRARENATVIPHPNLRDLVEEIGNKNYLAKYDEHYGSVNSRYH